MTKGTYRLDDEHSYTETITHSLTDPKLIGKENLLQYSFMNDNTLLVSYQLPGSNQMGREIWMRMVMPVLKEKSAQKL